MQMFFIVNVKNPGAFVALNVGYSLSRAVPREARVKTQQLVKKTGAMFATPYLSEAEAFIANAPPGVLRKMLEEEV